MQIDFPAQDTELGKRLGSTRDCEWRERLMPELREQYRRDGVIHIPQVIHPEWLALIAEGMRRNLFNLGHNSVLLHEGEPGEYLVDNCNYFVNPEYRHVLRYSPMADIMQYLLDTRELRLFYDQVFIKLGGNNRPTYWHQDYPYWLLEGTQLGSIWLSLDPVTKEQALEFVRGSHLGTQYGATTFNPDDPTEPAFPSLPRIPDIEAEREKWDIVSFATEPGDVIALHPGVLHGGGGTSTGRRRRTMTNRFFGDDVVLDGRFERSGELPNPLYPGLRLSIRPGERVRDPRLPLLRPLPEGDAW